MSRARILYLLLILSNVGFFCYCQHEKCKEPPTSIPGNSAFGSASDGFSKFLTETFVSTFTNAINDSFLLTNAFDINQTTPTEFRKFMYDCVKRSATKLGMECPHSIADTAAKVVEEHFETLIPPVIVRVFANTAAKFLQSEGLLNPINAGLLAVSYADSLKEFTRKTVEQDNPKAKLKALMDGIEKFFSSVFLLVQDNGKKIASIFANEVKLAAIDLRKKGKRVSLRRQ